MAARHLVRDHPAIVLVTVAENFLLGTPFVN